MFLNNISSPIGHSILRAKRATSTFWVGKSCLKMPKIVNFGEFWKPEASGQTGLPDRSILIWQKLVENAKEFKCDIFSDFQTLWCSTGYRVTKKVCQNCLVTLYFYFISLKRSIDKIHLQNVMSGSNAAFVMIQMINVLCFQEQSWCFLLITTTENGQKWFPLRHESSSKTFFHTLL